METFDNYKLLSGEVIVPDVLTTEDREYLTDLSAQADNGVGYFELQRQVEGPGAYPLRGGQMMTSAIMSSRLFRIAHDIADQIGIKQGYLLAPGTVVPDDLGPPDTLLSPNGAAHEIGISRSETIQALEEGRLQGRQIGNAWVTTRDDVAAFIKSQE